MTDYKDILYKSLLKNVENNLNMYIKSIKQDSINKRKVINKKDIKSPSDSHDS